MALVKYEYVFEQLGIGRSSVDELVRQGRLRKHRLAVTAKNKKRLPVRFDSDEVDRLKRQVLLDAPAAAKVVTDPADPPAKPRVVRRPRQPARPRMKVLNFD